MAVATWNLQNLFDPLDGEGEGDNAYLPLGLKKERGDAHKELCEKLSAARYRSQCRNQDWNELAVSTKLERLACVIVAMRQPEVLALQEVENHAILEALVASIVLMGGMEYAITHIDEPTGRGIDVALLHLLPRDGAPRLLPVRHRQRQQRGILTASFRLPDEERGKGSVMHMAVVHFPSPVSSSATRASSLKVLNEWASEVGDSGTVVALGDFNITAEEWSQVRIAEGVRQDWHVLHEEMCEDCGGSHFYWPRRSWSFLDMILLKRTAEPDLCANDLVPALMLPHIQLSLAEVPEGYAPKRARGVSDHLPLVTGFSDCAEVSI